MTYKVSYHVAPGTDITVHGVKTMREINGQIVLYDVNDKVLTSFNKYQLIGTMTRDTEEHNVSES